MGVITSVLRPRWSWVVVVLMICSQIIYERSVYFLVKVSGVLKYFELPVGTVGREIGDRSYKDSERSRHRKRKKVVRCSDVPPPPKGVQ